MTSHRVKNFEVGIFNFDEKKWAEFKEVDATSSSITKTSGTSMEIMAYLPEGRYGIKMGYHLLSHQDSDVKITIDGATRGIFRLWGKSSADEPACSIIIERSNQEDKSFNLVREEGAMAAADITLGAANNAVMTLEFRARKLFSQQSRIEQEDEILEMMHQSLERLTGLAGTHGLVCAEVFRGDNDRLD